MAEWSDNFNRPDTPAGSGLGTIPGGGPAWQVVAGSWRILSQRAQSDTAAGSSPVAAVDVNSADVDLSVSVSHLGGDAVYARVVDANNWLRARVRRWQTTTNYTTYVTEYRCCKGWYEGNDYPSISSGPHGHTYCDDWQTSMPSCTQAASLVHTHNVQGGNNVTHHHPANGTDIETREVAQTSPSTQTHYQVILEKCVAGSVQVLGTTTPAAPSQLRLRAVATNLKVHVNGSGTAAISTTDSAHTSATKHGIGRGPSDLTGTALDNFTVNALNTAPNPPPLTVPAVADLTEPLVVGVGFNDPDPGDTPSAARIRYRQGSGAWTEIVRSGQVYSVTIPADTLTAGTWEIHGQSTDAGGLVSGWSPPSFVAAAPPPADLSITVPANGATIPEEDFTFEVSHPTMDSWEWRVLDAADNEIIPITAEPGSTRAATATGLDDGTTVKIQARPIEAGITGEWTTSTNPVSFTRPAVAGVSIEQNYPVGAISVQAIHPEPTGGQPVAVSVDWWRREGDADGAPLVEGDTGIPHAFGQQLGANQVFRDWWITSGQHYAYRGRVHGDNGTTSWSPWISTDDDTPPLAPSGLAFTTDNDTSLTVTWLATLDDDTDQADLRYGVYRDGVLLTLTDPGVTTFADSDLTPGVGYVYEISAIDQAGNTATSDPLPASTFTPLPLTLPALLG